MLLQQQQVLLRQPAVCVQVQRRALAAADVAQRLGDRGDRRPLLVERGGARVAQRAEFFETRAVREESA